MSGWLVESCFVDYGTAVYVFHDVFLDVYLDVFSFLTYYSGEAAHAHCERVLA